MKAEIRRTGEIINVRQVITNKGQVLFEPLRLAWSKVKFTAAELNFDIDEEEEDALTIDGWVAIDEPFDQAYIYTQKPVAKDRAIADTGDYETVWESKNGKAYLLDRRFFPDMDCESEPKFVTITIKPSKHERN